MLSSYTVYYVYLAFLQNQIANLDKSIDDVLEHFVYLPKQSTANPQDIPFFLSTRLEDATTATEDTAYDKDASLAIADPVQLLNKYENRAIHLDEEYAENMIRF